MSSPVLSLDNIRKRFGELEVLHGISLQAQKGDVISLIGSSGSGKSTLLRCINLLEMPDEGEIHIGDESIALQHNRRGERVAKDEKQVQRLRTRVGMVFQQFNLWAHLTILQNVTEAPIRVLGMDKKEAEQAALEYLDKVGIADKADTYPSFLSGGQQQRAAIARALAMRPDVILFDEPTSALDPELVGEVLAVMRQLAVDGTTMITVTHEMNFARDVCNQVVYLHQGLIEEAGDPQQVFANPASARLQQFLSNSA
ncbi:MAG: ABC transporter ATP-binding protein [Granulosicoccaceae bacterium]